MLQRALEEREAARMAAFPLNPNAATRTNTEPQPDLCVSLPPMFYTLF